GRNPRRRRLHRDRRRMREAAGAVRGRRDRRRHRRRQGKVVDVICYPTSGAPVAKIPAESVPVKKTQNGSVVVLDAVDDGADIEGDLSVDANNVVIYGASPDVAVIGGDLTLTKNNTTVRGVRIIGDVTIELNNTNLVLC